MDTKERRQQLLAVSRGVAAAGAGAAVSGGAAAAAASNHRLALGLLAARLDPRQHGASHSLAVLARVPAAILRHRSIAMRCSCGCHPKQAGQKVQGAFCSLASLLHASPAV